MVLCSVCYEVFNYISVCHHIEKDEKCWIYAYLFCDFRIPKATCMSQSSITYLVFCVQQQYYFLCIRKKFTSKIDQTLKNTDASNSLSHLALAMVDVAICQENYDVAARYLRQTKNKVLCDYCNTIHSLQMYYYKDTVCVDRLLLRFINFILQ